MDTNGHMSYGLVQWNTGTYPNAAQYVQGGIIQDLKLQAKAIAKVVKGYPITGSTPGEIAANFASQFEGCQGCQPGGNQWSQRVANAEAYASLASSQAWESKRIVPKTTVPPFGPGMRTAALSATVARKPATIVQNPNQLPWPTVTPAAGSSKSYNSFWNKYWQNLVKHEPGNAVHTNARRSKGQAHPVNHPTAHHTYTLLSSVSRRSVAPARRPAPRPISPPHMERRVGMY